MACALPRAQWGLAFVVFHCAASLMDASAQASRRTQVDAYLRAEMERRRIPGLALLVLQDHRVVLAANYGLADVPRKVPVTDRTSFEIASMTKQFTAAAILLLAERGKLSVADSLSRYLPDLPPSWQSITIQQLMNHTAGLRDDWDEDDEFFISRTTSAEFLDALKASPLKFAPGTDWSYSAGPFVLGLLVERLSGRSYAQFMREALFIPLGMTATTVNDGARGSPDAASGYTVVRDTIRNGVRISPAAHSRADVGIRTTARDLALWDAALDQPTLLSAASRALMFTPGRLSNGEPIAHGLGWFVTPFRGHTEVAHGGSFRTGFNSIIARYPDDRLTVIILTNQFRSRSSEMARAVASFFNEDYRPIAMMRSQPRLHPSRTEAATRIMAALRDGHTPVGLVAGVGRLGGWSKAELRQELAHASAPHGIACQNLTGSDATAFGIPIVANCFYRTEGDRVRYWALSFTVGGQVAYLELEQ